MAVTKVLIGKKVKYRAIAYHEDGTYDMFGNPNMKHFHIGYYNTKKEGEKAYREYMDKFEARKIELNKNATVRNIINGFIEHGENEGEFSEGTICNYKGYRDNHLQDLIDVPVCNITKPLIQYWERNLHNKNVSKHIFNGCIKLLKSSFNYAISLDLIRTNPFKDLRAKTIPPKHRERFSLDQLKVLIDTAKSKLPDFYCIFILAVLTGARLGEYTAIRRNDINFNTNTMSITKQITRGKEKDRTKTDSSTRTINISNMVAEILRWHIETFNIKPNEHMFKTINGGLIYAKWVERRFEKLLTLCGHDKKFCRVHDLRGQYVDIMHLCNAGVTYIARQVGHSNSDITEKVYTQILKELPNEVNTRMDNLVFGTSDYNDTKEDK